MNIRKKHKIKKTLFALAGIFIPVYSLSFSYKGPYSDLLLVTFSQIGARYGAVEELIIWGIISSLYYFTFLSYLLTMSGNNNISLKILLSITCFTLLITVFLPFSPQMFPISARTHNFLAYVSSASIVIVLLLFIFNLRKIDRGLFYKALLSYLISISIVLLVLIKYGVSSLFQIVLCIVMCGLLFMLLIYLERCKNLNIYENLAKASVDDFLEDEILYKN